MEVTGYFLPPAVPLDGGEPPRPHPKALESSSDSEEEDQEDEFNLDFTDDQVFSSEATDVKSRALKFRSGSVRYS